MKVNMRDQQAAIFATSYCTYVVVYSRLPYRVERHGSSSHTRSVPGSVQLIYLSQALMGYMGE
jgi:hypothetical protein